jgi:hypothetical protein
MTPGEVAVAEAAMDATNRERALTASRRAMTEFDTLEEDVAVALGRNIRALVRSDTIAFIEAVLNLREVVLATTPTKAKVLTSE